MLVAQSSCGGTVLPGCLQFSSTEVTLFFVVMQLTLHYWDTLPILGIRITDALFSIQPSSMVTNCSKFLHHTHTNSRAF